MSLDLELSPRDHVTITASDVTTYGDNATFPKPFSSVFVGTTGTVVIKSMKGTIATFTAVPAGTMLNVAGIQVRAASTAGALVAIFGGP